MHKNPLDLWTYQEILFNKKPEVLVETGTLLGGSALFFANLMDIIGVGQVVTIDVKPPPKLNHDRIRHFRGESTNDNIVKSVTEMVAGKKTMVVLDSDHRAENVLAELKVYSDFVSRGQYLVVEDTNLSGWTALQGVEGPDQGNGPMAAVKEFMAHDDRFTIDRTPEKHLFSFFPCGFLLRK